jgi:phenol hydroxylase P5 protein
LAQPESPSGELTICFDRVEGGLGSGYLNTIEPGQEIVFAGPFGNFTAPDPLPERLVFVGRFTGIVPIRCMVHAICSHQRELALAPEILLVNSADRPENLLYHEEFGACALRSSRFRYIATVPGGGAGLDSRPETDILRDVLVGEGWGERLFVPMVSGLKALVYPVRDFFMEEFGLDRRDVRCESYD